MSDFFRSPTENDYQAAVEIVDDALTSMGGAWVAARLPEFDAKYNQRVYSRLETLAHYTQSAEILVEGPDLENPVPARRALRYGFQIGLDTVDELYGDRITFRHIISGFDQLIKNNRDPAMDPLNDQITTLRSIGQFGLQNLNFGSQLTVEKWSNVAVEEPYLRHHYVLGFGAVLFTAHATYDALIDGYAAKQAAYANWDELFPPTTGEKN